MRKVMSVAARCLVIMLLAGLVSFWSFGQKPSQAKSNNADTGKTNSQKTAPVQPDANAAAPARSNSNKPAPEQGSPKGVGSAEPTDIAVPGPVARPGGLPDLTIRIDNVGRPSSVGDNIEIPFRVTVQNIGSGPAGTFKVSVSYVIATGRRTGLNLEGGVPFSVPGQANIWYPATTAPLAARGQITFDGKVIFNKAYAGTGVRLQAIVDSIAGDEIMPDYVRVRESNETNNSSDWRAVDLPAGLPDLKLRSWTDFRYLVMEQNRLGRFITGFSIPPYPCTVENIGNAASASFKIAVEYQIVSGGGSLPRTGQIAIPDANRTSPGLPCEIVAGNTHTFDRLNITFPMTFAGARVKLRLVIDPDGAVAESNETNNTTRWSREIDIANLNIIITEADVRAMLRDLTGAVRLNNFAGPTNDFQLDNEPYRRNDSWVEINGNRSPSFTPQAVSGDWGWYYTWDLNGTISGGDAISIRNGKITIPVSFETASTDGEGEIRGWEYTWPYWYDSPPDFDISRLGILVYLTPGMRDGSIAVTEVGIGLSDFEIGYVSSFWEGMDPIIEAITGTSIIGEVRKEIPRAINSPEVRALIEGSIQAQVSEILRGMPLPGSVRILNVIGSRNTIIIVYELT